MKLVRKLYEHRKQFLELEMKIYKMLNENKKTGQHSNNDMSDGPSFANSV